MTISLTNFRLVGRLVVLVALLCAAAFTLSRAPGASALPCHEVTTYFYSDATQTTQVGERDVTCYGVTTTGTVTQYYQSFDGDCCGCCGYCPDWCF
ncbi:MAG TPA: hypothetical protein VF521_09570 [Pyrinomonadaceae bacterium]|jgi:hypothetical protein